ncbi:MAG: endonuclease III [Candidatus Aenigmarchaeota archaeon]|nr:endonuclease III [Candidatus Aenigmarchaeota archaeon]
MKKEAIKRDAPVYRKRKLFGKDPFKNLILAILSSRTRDENLYKIGKGLFEKVKSPKDILEIDKKELERILFGIGFYKVKARILKEVSRQILEDFNGKVPDNLNDLLKLKGVGKKVAKVVLASVFNKPFIAVDTHVHRISNRIGLVKTKTPEETDKILNEIIPDNLKIEFNRIFVGFGQTVCKPRNPLCEECPLKKICPKIGLATRSARSS